MSAYDIRNTIGLLEANNIELVAGRDFDLVAIEDKDGVDYALGNTVHDDGDVRKNDYSLYRKVRDGGFEHNGKFYPQEFYVEVGRLPVSPYASRSEVNKAFQDSLSKI